MAARIKIEIDGGTSIDRACEDAQRMANILGIAVEFTFNSVTCYAGLGGSAEVLSEKWRQELKRELNGPLDRRFAHSVDRKRQLAIAMESGKPLP